MELNPGALLLSGFVASCGGLLALAGVSKVYRGARGADDDAAIRRALRIPAGRWRAVEVAVGSLEVAVAAVVCTLRYPAPAGAALIVLGAVFCGLLTYVRARRVPGGCGCLGWRSRPELLTWRAVARPGLLLAAGAAELAVLRPDLAVLRPGPAPVEPGLALASRPWFGCGALAGILIWMLLSIDLPVRTPPCGRPLINPARATLRALAGHGVFAAMAATAGPFGPAIWYRKRRCTDEFWFTAPEGAVVFRVERAAAGGALVVQATLVGPGPTSEDMTGGR